MRRLIAGGDPAPDRAYANEPGAVSHDDTAGEIVSQTLGSTDERISSNRADPPEAEPKLFCEGSPR